MTPLTPDSCYRSGDEESASLDDTETLVDSNNQSDSTARNGSESKTGNEAAMAGNWITCSSGAGEQRTCDVNTDCVENSGAEVLCDATVESSDKDNKKSQEKCDTDKEGIDEHSEDIPDGADGSSAARTDTGATGSGAMDETRAVSASAGLNHGSIPSAGEIEPEVTNDASAVEAELLTSVSIYDDPLHHVRTAQGPSQQTQRGKTDLVVDQSPTRSESSKNLVKKSSDIKLNENTEQAEQNGAQGQSEAQEQNAESPSANKPIATSSVTNDNSDCVDVDSKTEGVSEETSAEAGEESNDPEPANPEGESEERKGWWEEHQEGGVKVQDITAHNSVVHSLVVKKGQRHPAEVT